MDSDKAAAVAASAAATATAPEAEAAAAAAAAGVKDGASSIHRNSVLPTLRRQQTKHLTLLLKDISWPSVGLCLSSDGGLHGAAFGAGVLSRLLAARVRLDFLSAVSAGSVVATSYMDWKVREGGADADAWHRRYFARLLDGLWRCTDVSGPRQFARTQAKRLCGGLLHAALSVAFLAAVVFVSLAGRVLHARWSEAAWHGLLDAPLLSGWPSLREPIVFTLWLHAVGLLLLVARSRVSSASSLSIVHHFTHTILTIVPLLIFTLTIEGLFNEGVRVSDIIGRTCHEMLANGTNITNTSSTAAAAAAAASVTKLQATTANTTAAAGSNPYGCNLLAHMTLLSIPGVSFLLNVLVGSVFIGARRSFSIVAVSYFILLIRLINVSLASADITTVQAVVTVCCMAAFYLTPLYLPYHRDLFFRAFEERLRASFFHPSQIGPDSEYYRRVFAFPTLSVHGDDDAVARDRGKRSTDAAPPPRDLRLGDLSKVKPELIVQCSLNNWRNDITDPRDDRVKILSISSKTIDIIHHRDREDISLYLDLVPGHLKLSTAMATSTPWLAILTGTSRRSMEFLHGYFLLLRPRKIKYLPVWADAVPSLAGKIAKTLLVTMIQLCATLDCLFYVVNGEVPAFVQPFSTLCRVSIAFLALFPSDHNVRDASELQKYLFVMSRWLVINMPLCHYVRSIANITNVGRYPDFLLEMDHCSDLEHTGLLALLRRRTHRIIVADGGTPASHDHAERIMETLQRARKYLGCRFATVDDEDVSFELYRKLGCSTHGVAPHAILIKVYYTAEHEGEREVIDEGEILILQPRHPDKLEKGEWSGDLGDGWSAEEADKLSDFFSNFSDHWLWRTMTGGLGGKFPYNDKAFHPTEAQIQAMFREGERAMSSSEVQDFVNELPKAEQRTETSAVTAQHCDDGDGSLPKPAGDLHGSDESGRASSPDAVSGMGALGLQKEAAGSSGAGNGDGREDDGDDDDDDEGRKRTGLRRRRNTKQTALDGESPPILPPRLPPRDNRSSAAAGGLKGGLPLSVGAFEPLASPTSPTRAQTLPSLTPTRPFGEGRDSPPDEVAPMLSARRMSAPLDLEACDLPPPLPPKPNLNPVDEH